MREDEVGPLPLQGPVRRPEPACLESKPAQPDRAGNVEPIQEDKPPVSRPVQLRAEPST